MDQREAQRVLFGYEQHAHRLEEDRRTVVPQRRVLRPPATGPAPSATGVLRLLQTGKRLPRVQEEDARRFRRVHAKRVQLERPRAASRQNEGTVAHRLVADPAQRRGTLHGDREPRPRAALACEHPRQGTHHDPSREKQRHRARPRSGFVRRHRPGRRDRESEAFEEKPRKPRTGATVAQPKMERKQQPSQGTAEGGPHQRAHRRPTP